MAEARHVVFTERLHDGSAHATNEPRARGWKLQERRWVVWNISPDGILPRLFHHALRNNQKVQKVRPLRAHKNTYMYVQVRTVKMTGKKYLYLSLLLLLFSISPLSLCCSICIFVHVCLVLPVTMLNLLAKSHIDAMGNNQCGCLPCQNRSYQNEAQLGSVRRRTPKEVCSTVFNTTGWRTFILNQRLPGPAIPRTRPFYSPVSRDFALSERAIFLVELITTHCPLLVFKYHHSLHRE